MHTYVLKKFKIAPASLDDFKLNGVLKNVHAIYLNAMDNRIKISIPNFLTNEKAKRMILSFVAMTVD